MMRLPDAVAECERWLAHLEAQRQRSLKLQKLASDRRLGSVNKDEALRRMNEIDGSIKVYDGAKLADAVGVLLAAVKAPRP
jgi:hypothetical protein